MSVSTSLVHTLQMPVLQAQLKKNLSQKKHRLMIVDKPQFSALIHQMLDKRYHALCLDDAVCALKHMLAEKPDLVVIDAGVKGDGLRLAELMQVHPELKAIPLVVTCLEPTDELVSRVRRAQISSLIAKPFRPSTLMTQIEIEMLRAETAILSDDVETGSAFSGILSGFCPSLDLSKYLTSTADDEGFFDLIKQDEACQSALLHLANSSFSPKWREIDSFKLAVSMMGVREARIAASCVQVLQALRAGAPRPQLNMPSLLKHCVGTALVARGLSKRMALDPDACFYAGFLHDLGKVVLDGGFGVLYAEVRDEAREQNAHTIDLEKDLLGVTHAQVGQELAKVWGADESVADAIYWHHDPTVSGHCAKLASLVHVANHICHKLTYGSSGESTKQADADVLLSKALWKLGLSPQALDELVEAGKKELVYANAFLEALMFRG